MEKEIFANMILSNEESFYRISKSILQSDSDCEDAIHNAILKAYENISSLKEEKYFKTWFIRILINECRKIRREQQKINNIKTRQQDYINNDIIETDDTYSQLYAAINKLPEKIRVTIELFYIEDMSIDSISKMLRIPKGTVKSRLNNGRRQLKGLLEDDYEDR